MRIRRWRSSGATAAPGRGARLRPAALLAALVVLGGSSAAAAEVGEVLGYAKSSSMYSNATDIVYGQPQPATLLRLQNQKLAVRSVPLGDIKAGQTIKALAEVELTNDLVTKDANGDNVRHDVAVEATLVIATSPTATSGIEVAEAQGSYVTPQVHHWTLEKSGTFTARQNYSGRYLNLVMWAYTPEKLTECWTFPRAGLPDPQQPRDCGMDVYYNRGHLSVLRDSSPTAAATGALPFSVQQFSGQSIPEASPSDAPIVYQDDPGQYIVAMARPVGALKAGDILTAHSELQVDARNVVRSNVYCNVMVASRLYLSPSPSLSGAIPIGNEGGHNFSGREQRKIKTLEQGVVPSSTTYRVPQSYSTPMYVVLRVWTKGNSACELYGNGVRVQLVQGQSFMHVMRYRPEQQASLVADTYNSGNKSERASSLNVVTGARVSVYSRQLTKLAPGQLIEALAEMEVDTGYHRAGVHTTFVLADSPGATTGTNLQVDNFTEVNPYMKSLPIHDSTAWVVPSGISGTKYLNLVAYGQRLQTLGTAPNDTISIASDDGRLVVQRFRPPTP